MNTDLAKTIIDWHLQQSIQNLELEETFPGSLCDEDGNLNDLQEIIKVNELPADSKVLLKLDYCVNNQDDEADQAEKLLQNYEDGRDLYCITVNFDNDDFGNKQYYKFLIQ